MHPEEISKIYREQIPTGKTRSATRKILNFPKHKTALYERSPLYRTITTWNKLPQEVKMTEPLNFKKQAQKHMIQTAYGELPDLDKTEPTTD